MNLNKTIENLQKNRMNVIVAEHKEEVLSILRDLMPQGATVTHGGSVTLEECGIPEFLRSENYQYLDRSKAKDPTEIYLKGYSADVFLTGSNAITENGELYNVDGNSNRISMICHGPKKVIVIAGLNKIVETLDEAIYRVKTVAAPQNAARLQCNTYCATHGKCISLSKENPSMTDGCGSAVRICRNYLISGAQKNPERITVIIVKENLGY